MGYIRKRKVKRQGPVMEALGDLASTITNLASTVGIAADLATDPYLPETVCRVGQLKALNANQRAGACATTKDNLGGGVGLRKFVKPLRGYVYAQQHKWVYPAAVAAILGLPFIIGYAAGKGSR